MAARPLNFRILTKLPSRPNPIISCGGHMVPGHGMRLLFLPIKWTPDPANVRRDRPRVLFYGPSLRKHGLPSVARVSRQWLKISP